MSARIVLSCDVIDSLGSCDEQLLVQASTIDAARAEAVTEQWSSGDGVDRCPLHSAPGAMPLRRQCERWLG